MPSKLNSGSMPFQLRVIGSLLILTLVITNTIYYGLTNILWLCNISALLAGVALLLGMRQMAPIGATFMILGLSAWLMNIAVNNGFEEPVSYITHFSFAAAALYIFVCIPVGRRLWAGCFCWWLLCQLLSRLFTPPELNINLAFSIWPGWERMFSNFFSFWCFTNIGCLVFLFVMNKLISRFQRARGFVLATDSFFHRA